MVNKITRKIYLPVLVAVIISGCQATGTINTGGSPTPAPTATSVPTPTPTATPGTKTETFEALSNSTIKNGQVTSGNNIVFRYTQSVDPIPMAVDDEYANTVIFEITKNEKDNFTYENGELAIINAYIIHSCFCAPDTTAPKPLLKGKITGTKLNNDTWKIDGTNDIVNFSGEFKIK
jgi:hypothetical protein